MSVVQKILDRKGHHVYSIEATENVLDAAITMNEHRVGALVVTSGEKIVGMFTERDILNRVVAGQKDPSGISVRDVMSSPVVVCGPETTTDERRGVMRRRRLRHLPVVDGDRILGLISIGDLYEATEANQDQTIRELYEYVLGSPME